MWISGGILRALSLPCHALLRFPTVRLGTNVFSLTLWSRIRGRSSPKVNIKDIMGKQHLFKNKHTLNIPKIERITYWNSCPRKPGTASLRLVFEASSWRRAMSSRLLRISPQDSSDSLAYPASHRSNSIFYRVMRHLPLLVFANIVEHTRNNKAFPVL